MQVKRFLVVLIVTLLVICQCRFAAWAEGENRPIINDGAEIITAGEADTVTSSGVSVTISGGAGIYYSGDTVELKVDICSDIEIYAYEIALTYDSSIISGVTKIVDSNNGGTELNLTVSFTAVGFGETAVVAVVSVSDGTGLHTGTGKSGAVRARCGDINANEVVNILDAQIVYDLVRGEYKERSDYAAMMARSDVNQDGTVDAADARAIQYYIHNKSIPIV